MKKLKGANAKYAIYCSSGFGPTFGGGHDMNVSGSNVSLRPGHSYDRGPNNTYTYNNC
jgi:hypothetical protein